MKIRRLFLSAGVILVAFTLARAGPNPTASGPGEEMILFQELPSVFGASKYEQKPSEAPASVSIITADEIQRYGYRTLSDILRSVRGLFTTYDRNYTYIGVRGFDRPGDYDTRVLLLLDGHRMNDNVYDQAAIGTESLIDVEDIDRVEVIRGPSSSLYGTNAFLAVVNVISKSGRILKGGQVEAESASFNTGKGRLAYGTKLKQGAEVYLSGSYYDSEGQSLFFPEFNDPATNNGFADKADDDRYGHAFGKLTYGNLLLEGGFSTRTKSVPTASFGVIFNDPREKTTDRRDFLSLKYDRDLGQESRFSGSVSYDGYWYDGDYPYTTGNTKDYGYGRWWTAEAQSMTTLRDRHKIIYGAEVRYSNQQDQGYYQVAPFASYLNDTRQSSIWALYAQDEFRMADNVILNAGLRRDDYTTFGGTTNPRLALIFGAQKPTALKILYGEAFRAPNAYELYYQDGGQTQERNPDLRPETIRTYEVDLEHSYQRGLRSVVSVYHYGIRNLITLEPDPLNPGLSIFENVDRVKADGAEFEVEGSFAHRLDGRVSYAYQNTANELTGARLTNSPRHLAKLNLSTPLAADKLRASVEVLYLSGRDTLVPGHTGGYTLTNLTLLGRNWRSGLGVSFSVYNLFDVKYGDPGGDEHVQQVIPQDGRNYRLQVKYDF